MKNFRISAFPSNGATESNSNSSKYLLAFPAEHLARDISSFFLSVSGSHEIGDSNRFIYCFTCNISSEVRNFSDGLGGEHCAPRRASSASMLIH